MNAWTKMLRCTIAIVRINFKGIFLKIHLMLVVHHKEINNNFSISSSSHHPCCRIYCGLCCRLLISINIVMVKTTNAQMSMAHL